MSASLFRYTARTADGEALRGTIAASGESAVLAALRSRALVVTGVRRESHAATALGSVGAGGRRRALLSFFRAFAALSRAGVPIRRALEVTIERTGERGVREALRGVAADIEAGASLAEALSRRPSFFRPLHVAMIRAGEASGTLDEILARVATLLERDADLRRRLRAALAYPALVIAGTAMLLVFLLVRVLPAFGQMFAAFHAEPPAATRVLLALGAALERPATWSGIALAGGTVATAFVVAGRSRWGAAAFDRVRLSLPAVGPLVRKAVVARIARTVGTLLRSGIPVVTAIEAANAVASSATYRGALRRVAGGVRAGESLSAELGASGLFDPFVLALARAGEESGLLDELLLAAASYLEAEVEAGTAALAGVLEPALLIAVGLAVGFIVFSVFIPLYALLGSVSS